MTIDSGNVEGISEEKLAYFQSTADKPVRDDLVQATKLAHPLLVNGKRVAIDCGCGAGADIAFLRGQGYTVHAFDVEPEAIRQCDHRFEDDAEVHLDVSTFSTFDYPRSTLVVADASLFFCPPDEFSDVWQKITGSLVPGGVFCGSFLGPDDTMASEGFERGVFWPYTTVMTEITLREHLAVFEVVNWTEHRHSGETAQGVPHNWHIFAVVAVKESEA